MTPDDFRALGHRMVDFIADYWSTVGDRPVLSQATPGETLSKLPAAAPDEPEHSWNNIFDDLEKIILPGVTHWQHPSFFAYFPANASGPAVLGELLSAGLGVQGMLWLTSPACTELETRVLDWTADLLGLPACFRSDGPTKGGGVIQGTASEAALVALVAARNSTRRALLSHSLTPPPPHPLTSPRFTLYASDQTHSSIVKAAMIAGLADGPDDRRLVRLLPTDDHGSMLATALEQAMRDDLAAGLTPCFVCATVGTTATTAVDPLDQIAAAIDRVFGPRTTTAPRPWLHVDAAHAGSACVCEEHRWMIKGVEDADSFCFNPHKWLLTNFDCDCFYVRDRRTLIDALSVTPEYLRNAATDTGAVIDYRDWQIPLGRRFRALKLWFVLRHYGTRGLQAHVRFHVRLASLFESLLKQDDRFEVVAARPLNLVCFRLSGSHPEETDERNRALLAALNASGRVFLTHATLPKAHRHGGRVFLRMAIGGTWTREEHVRAAWDLIRAEADRIGR
jgi:aromatic-L-amino-acid decarboxylase